MSCNSILSDLLLGDCNTQSASVPGCLFNNNVYQQLEEELHRYLPTYFHLFYRGGEGGAGGAGAQSCSE